MQFLAKLLLINFYILSGLTPFALGGVTFESLESKTSELKPVYNRISFEQKSGKDIWVMQQSHGGPNLPLSEWDSIAIVVEKRGTENRATFYQLPQGTLHWTKKIEAIPYKAACFMCHANGPRAIRPNLKSSDFNLTVSEKIQLMVWNLRIKSYGKIESVGLAGHGIFRHESELANAPLMVKACTRCHRDTGLFARGTLTRQNFMAIKFMVEQKFMPPLWFGINEEEKKEIQEFIGSSD